MENNNNNELTQQDIKNSLLRADIGGCVTNVLNETDSEIVSFTISHDELKLNIKRKNLTTV